MYIASVDSLAFLLVCFLFITKSRLMAFMMLSPTQLPAVSESRLRICWRVDTRLAGKAGLLQNRDQGLKISLGRSPGICGLSC